MFCDHKVDKALKQTNSIIDIRLLFDFIFVYFDFRSPSKSHKKGKKRAKKLIAALERGKVKAKSKTL